MRRPATLAATKGPQPTTFAGQSHARVTCRQAGGVIAINRTFSWSAGCLELHQIKRPSSTLPHVPSVPSQLASLNASPMRQVKYQAPAAPSQR